MSGFVAGETPEGWYDDPQSGHPGAERWWNGVQWTAHTRRSDPAPVRPPTLSSPATGALPEDLFVSRTVGGQTEVGLPPGAVVRTVYGAQVAGPGPRALAWLLDTGVVALVALVLTVPLTLLGMAVSSLATGGPVTLSTGGTPFWAIGVAVCWCHHAIGLSRRGASRGQRTMRLGVRPWRVNGRLTRRQVLLRSALMTTPFVGGALGGAALGMAAFGLLAVTVVTGSSRRGIHEVWTDTCTVHVR